MQEQLVLQHLLRNEFETSRARNPAYSLRSYSRRVGVNPGALSGILNGKRNVSRELAERMMHRLALDPQKRSEVLRLFPERRRRSEPMTAEQLSEERYQQVPAHQFKVISEWEHFAIFSLVECTDFQSDENWMATRLSISVTKVHDAIERLIAVDLLAYDETGKLIQTKKAFRTTDDVADLSLKRCHDETLHLARESLYQHSVEKRDFSSITMAVDPEKLRMAKERIRQFQDELSDLLESGNRTEVYRLSMQLFPLSKTKE